MESEIFELVKDSKVLISDAFSINRILILLALEELGLDGSSYRELRAGLELDDGVLYSSLNALEKVEYVKKNEKEERVDKEQTSYAITIEGKKALQQFREWFKKIIEKNNKGGK